MVGSALDHTPGSIQTSPEGPESLVELSQGPEMQLLPQKSSVAPQKPAEEQHAPPDQEPQIESSNVGPQVPSVDSAPWRQGPDWQPLPQNAGPLPQ